MVYVLLTGIILLKLADLLYKYNYYMEIDTNDLMVIVAAIMVCCLV
jgi:hypothetical protein